MKIIQCSFCPDPADTVEHVIPKWLQRYYGLFNQTMRLWNGSTLYYRYARIPACKVCNGIRLSALEQRINLGQASERDYYLWSLKLRYGLAIIDSGLLVDRKDPEKGFLLPKELAKYKSEFIIPALQSLDDKNFRFSPDPFGSVFIFDQKSNNQKAFGFADIPPPYWAISITLPPNKIIVVLFADRGVVKSVSGKIGLTSDLEKLSQIPNEMLSRWILFDLIRTQNLVKIPDRVSIDSSSIISEPIPRRLQLRNPKRRWYLELAGHCGISNEVALAAYKDDRTDAISGYIDWK